jgi:hypothetical protein
MIVYKDQVLGGTQKDEQGEKLSLNFLIDFSEKKEILLHQHHDILKNPIGIIKNMRVVAAEGLDEWHLIGDVFITEGSITEAMRCFSISGTELIIESAQNSGLIYIPFPHYADIEYVNELFHACNKEISIGKWIKKGDESNLTSLILSAVILLVTPAWEELYKNKIAPFFARAIKEYFPILKKHKISIEVVQILMHLDMEIEVRFLPNKEKLILCHSPDKIQAGINTTIEFLRNDSKSNSIGAARIVLYFDDSIASYKLHRVEYTNSDAIHFL